MSDDFEEFLRDVGREIQFRTNQAIIDGLLIPNDVRQKISELGAELFSAANCIKQLKERK